MSDEIRKIWNGVTTALVVIVVILAILLVGLRFAGLQIYTVLSGSMEPVYRVGSLIYVKTVETRELEAGDVITFRLEGDTVMTHRIVEVIADGEDTSRIQFRTKGDANNMVDGALVQEHKVLGSPVFSIPLLGYLAHFIQNPPGTYLTVSAGALLLLLVLLPDLLCQKKKD